MYPISAGQRPVTVLVNPDTDVAHVYVSGDVDIAAEAALVEAVEQLCTAAPRAVHVDLAAVTFACSTLLSFLVRVRQAVPDGTRLVVCRPNAATQRLLILMGLEPIVIVCDGPLHRDLCVASPMRRSVARWRSISRLTSGVVRGLRAERPRI